MNNTTKTRIEFKVSKPFGKTWTRVAIIRGGQKWTSQDFGGRDCDTQALDFIAGLTAAYRASGITVL